MLHFEWDEQKNKRNRKKHGIWFEEAEQVFDDPAALRFFDPEHSDDEDRFLMLGMSGSNRVLVIVFCERGKRTLSFELFRPGKPRRKR